MPKFSIYIPDDLWTEVQASSPNAKPSPLVQDALRRFLATQAPQPRTRLPEAVLVERERVIRKSVAAAEKSYVDGYRIGLVFIDLMPWAAIEDFERLDWDIEAWDVELGNYQVLNGDGDVWDFDETWNEFANGQLDSVLATTQRPMGILKDGFVDAFRDVLAAAHAFPGHDDAQSIGDDDAVDSGSGEETNT